MEATGCVLRKLLRLNQGQRQKQRCEQRGQPQAWGRDSTSSGVLESPLVSSGLVSQDNDPIKAVAWQDASLLFHLFLKQPHGVDKTIECVDFAPGYCSFSWNTQMDMDKPDL